MKYDKPVVIDNYFPDWLVDHVGDYFAGYPVTFTNSPTAVYENAKFFGNMIMTDDQWTVPEDIQSWFIEYFNNCIYFDICKNDNITHCHRILLNGQVKGQKSQNHCDSDYDCYLSVIYHASGTSGSTVFVNDSDEDVQEVEFKPGRMILFNSTLWHRGDPPVDDNYRVSLGCVYPMVPIQDLPHPV